MKNYFKNYSDQIVMHRVPGPGPDQSHPAVWDPSGPDPAGPDPSGPDPDLDHDNEQIQNKVHKLRNYLRKVCTGSLLFFCLF